MLKGQLTLLATSVLSQSLLAWSLAPTGRGTYALVATYGQLLPVLFAFALDRAIQIRLISGRCSLRLALRFSTVVVVTASSLGTIALIVLRLVSPAIVSQLGLGAAVFTTLLMPATLAFTFALRIYTARKQFRHYYLVLALQACTNVALLVAFVPGMGLGTSGALAALLASYLVPLGVALVGLHAEAPANAERLGRRGATEMFAFAWRAYPATVGHALDFGIGAVLLGLLAPAAEVGLLAAASAIMLKFLLVPQSLQEALLPRIAADPRGRPELVALGARVACLVTMGIVLSFLVVSRPVVLVLLSAAFLPALPLLWWMGFGVVLHGASTVLMPYFDGTQRPGIVSLAVWAGLTVNVTLTIVLYDHFGASAAAMAFSAGLAARFLVLAVVFERSSGLRPRELVVPRRQDAKLLWDLLHGAAGALAARARGR